MTKKMSLLISVFMVFAFALFMRVNVSAQTLSITPIVSGTQVSPTISSTIPAPFEVKTYCFVSEACSQNGVISSACSDKSKRAPDDQGLVQHRIRLTINTGSANKPKNDNSSPIALYECLPNAGNPCIRGPEDESLVPAQDDEGRPLEYAFEGIHIYPDPNNWRNHVELVDPKKAIITVTTSNAFQIQYCDKDNNNKNDADLTDPTNFDSNQTNDVCPVANRKTVVTPWVEWQSYSHPGLSRIFHYRQRIASTNTFRQDTSGGLQNYTFDIPYTGEVCTEGVTYDPYGVVFDAADLKRIQGASVKLKVKRISGNWEDARAGVDSDDPFFKNPYLTLEDGVFNFVVQPGTYKLEVTSPAGYSWPIDLNNVNPSWSQVYTVLYNNPDEEIIQGTVPVRKDIPLQSSQPVTPTAGASARNIIPPVALQQKNTKISNVLGATDTPVKIMEYFYQLDRSSNSVYFQGRVSQPFTKVTAFTKKASGTDFARGREVGTVNADKDGRFRLVIDQNGFAPDEVFGEIELGEVVIDEHIEKPKNAVVGTSSFVFDPILNHVEGYAYDANGRVMTNTLVTISQGGSNDAYYQTQTDDKGYFKVSSEYLPNMPYDIHYGSAGTAAPALNTTDFAVKNVEYIVEEKKDLNAFVNKNGQTLQTNPSKRPVNTTPGANQGTNGTPAQQGGESAQALPASFYLMATILLVLLIATGIMIGVYLYKKNNSS